jgi:hypothetical protein
MLAHEKEQTEPPKQVFNTTNDKKYKKTAKKIKTAKKKIPEIRVSN